MDEERYIAVFASYNQTSLMHNILNEKGIIVEIIATPSRISVGCSRAIKFKPEDLRIVENEIKRNAIKCKGIFAPIKYKNILTYVVI